MSALPLAHGGKSLLIQEISRDVSLWNRRLQSCSSKGLHEQVLLLYKKMRDGGVLPDASTLPSLLRSCASLFNVHLGEGFHALVHRSGIECDPYVGSSLVHMYVKCEGIENAHKVLERMTMRNVAAWTALIQGYAQIGSPDKAVELFGRMQLEDGIRPNAVTVVCLVPACFCLWDGKCFHGHVIKLGLESDSLVGTSLTDMYMKFQAVENANRVFDGVGEKNDVSWLVMVSGLARNGLVRDAASLAARMLLDFKLVLDSVALVSVISACTEIEDLACGKWVHVYVIKTGLELDAFVGTALLNFYGRCGLMELAGLVFSEIPEPNLVSWNALMYLFALRGLLEKFMELFRQLMGTGLFPDLVTLRSCFLALVSSPEYRRESLLGESVHSLAIKCGFFDSEISIANSVLDFYAKLGNWQSAEELFFNIADRRDTISWNCMISGYLRNGLSREAILTFHHMRSSYTLPDSYTLSSVLTACASMGEQLIGRCTHAYMLRQGYCLWDSFVATSLVNMYAKCGDVSSAYKAFEYANARDRTMWNAMIAGYGQNGYSLEALALFCHHFRSMEGLLSSDSAVATAVSACGHLGSLQRGRSLHGYVTRTGLDGNMEVGNAILSMYSKCGAVKDAELFFGSMEEKDTASWTSMIAGYGTNGRVDDALSLFELMITENHKEKDVRPNEVTFLEVLWACAHGGLVKEGWDYFERMTRIFGIRAKAEHYCCMVDLLGRGGYLYEAYVLIRSMKVSADAAVWGALLGACRVHGELELVEVAGRELSRVEDGNSSSYWVLLSNTYADGGWWEHAERVREEAQAAVEGLKRSKPPGWSCIQMRELSGGPSAQNEM